MTRTTHAARRRLLGCALGTAVLAPLRGARGASSGTRLAAWIRHPLLVDTLYRHAVSRDYDAAGAAGANTHGFRWIEEQRQGAEWIVRGAAQGRADWLALGWRELDWGLGRQRADGGFDSEDAFHSTSLFVEALARACLLDPPGATYARCAGLRRAADWLSAPAVAAAGARGNQPYTHRRYILAAGFGQSAQVLDEPRFAARAAAWADEGLSLQQPDGTNPERGGFDAGYQMAGVLFATRYLAAGVDADRARRLGGMIGRAIALELERLRDDGSIDAEGSTRVERERARSGRTKEVPYAEITQALVFAAQLPGDPAWLDAARRIATARGW
jgi:hypothetical protein